MKPIRIGDWEIVSAPLPMACAISPHNNLGNREPFLVVEEDTEYRVVVRHRKTKQKLVVLITIYAGFCYDGPSIPSIIPISALDLSPAAEPHDALYRFALSLLLIPDKGVNRKVTVDIIGGTEEYKAPLRYWIADNQREFADKLLLAHMQELTTVHKITKKAVYAGVRVFGRSSFMDPQTQKRMDHYKRVLEQKESKEQAEHLVREYEEKE